MKRLVIITVCLLGVAVAQVDTVWTRRYTGPADQPAEGTLIAEDRGGNVVVAGYVWTSTAADYLVIKYSPTGDTLWTRTFTGTGINQDNIYGMVIDDSDNIYVTGRVWNAGCVTIKYDPNGSLLWADTLPGFDARVALAPSGGVYVAVNDASDFLTARYSATGDTLWTRRFGTAGSEGPTAIAVDPSGNAVVAGYDDDSLERNGYLTLKYSPGGDTLWTRRYNGSGHGDEWPAAVGCDAAGNIYVAGCSYSATTDYDCTLLKYSPAGDLLWAGLYDGPYGGTDETYDLAIDGNGSAHITGRQQVASEDYDILTIKYQPDGDTAWVRTVANMFEGDMGTAVKVNGHGDVFVAGILTGNTDEYTLVSYDRAGTERWLALWQSPDESEDRASALAIDEAGYAYVTGYTAPGGSDEDVITVKWSYAPGIEDNPGPRASSPRPAPTIVRGVLFMAGARDEGQGTRDELLDISGRQVLDLKRGANDVSRLASGVYFVDWTEEGRGPLKVLVPR